MNCNCQVLTRPDSQAYKWFHKTFSKILSSHASVLIPETDQWMLSEVQRIEPGVPALLISILHMVPFFPHGQDQPGRVHWSTSEISLWATPPFSSSCTEITLTHSLHVGVPAPNALLHLALYLECLGNVIVLAFSLLVFAYTSFIPVIAEKTKHICLLLINHVLENQINIQSESP